MVQGILLGKSGVHFFIQHYCLGGDLSASQFRPRSAPQEVLVYDGSIQRSDKSRRRYVVMRKTEDSPSQSAQFFPKSVPF